MPTQAPRIEVAQWPHEIRHVRLSGRAAGRNGRVREDCVDVYQIEGASVGVYPRRQRTGPLERFAEHPRKKDHWHTAVLLKRSRLDRQASRAVSVRRRDDDL